MIVIYERDAVDFSTNGLGTLAPQSCLAEETMNGGYEVTLVHPLDEAGKYKKIQKERILRVPVPAASTPRIHVGAAAAVSRDIYKVVTDGRRLNIRAAPDNGKIIGSYKPGTEVVVIDRESNESWSEVTGPDGKHGWMWTGNLEYVRTETTGTEAEESIKEAAALRDQPFRIYKVVPTLTEITVYARHIFYDLMDNMVATYKPTESTTGAQAVAGLSAATEEAHGFTFYSDLDTTAEDVEITDKNPAEAMLDDGGLIEAYGGELMRDWWDIYLVKRIGSETGLQIREGKNLLGISYSEDMTNAVTRIIPRGEDKDGNKLYLPERYIENTAEDRPVYAHHKWRVLDVKEAKEKTSGDEKRTIEDCYRLMREAAAKAFEEGCDYPDITLDVNFIDCAATEEYRQYRQLQSVHMGDTVRVWTKRSGISAALRMTHYIYNCLTEQYEKMTLGAAEATIEGNMISPRSIGSGTIKGSMLAQGSVGAGAIQDGAVNSLKIALAAIGYAHIGQAAIGQLAADAITAVRADIRELVAGNITTDKLYADLAAIAVAQITTANIQEAKIEWADIANLTAAIAEIANAEIANAEIDWAQIKNAHIDAADVNNLSAAVAEIANAQIGVATIDYAKIVDAVMGTAIITKGVGEKLFIERLAVTDANMVSLTVGALMVKAEDGSFQQLVVDSDGNVTGKKVEVEGDNIAAATIPGGKLIEDSITARELNVGSIFADEALIRAIKAANIDVADLFAADATIAALDNYILRTTTIEALKGSLDVWANEKIGLAVNNVRIGGRNLLRNTGNLKKANYSFDNSGASAMGSYEEDGEGGFHIVCANANLRWWVGTLPVTPGQSYAMSVRYRMNSGEVPIQFQYIFKDQALATAAYSDSNSLGQTETRVQDGWTILSSVFTVPAEGGYAYLQIAVRTGEDFALYTCDYNIGQPQFEAGNKPTDWSPAPEDTDADIGEVRQAVMEITPEYIVQQVMESDEYTEDMASIRTTAQEIQLAVESQQVGGTNLIGCAEGSIWVKTGVVSYEWEKNSYYNRSGTGVWMTAWSGSYNEIRFKTDIYVTPGQYTLSFYSWYTYLTTNIRIRPNLLGDGADIYFDDQAFMPPPSTPTKHTFVLNVEHTGKVILRFVTMTPWSVGNVFFSDVKLERGNTATDWSPHPGDPAGELDTGTDGGVQVTITKDRFEVDVPGEDGDFELNETGGRLPVLISGHVEAPNVAARYDGPDVITISKDAANEQIAGGGYFRGISEAFAALSNRMLTYGVTIRLMNDDFSEAELCGVYGSAGSVRITGGYSIVGAFRAVNMGCALILDGVTIRGNGDNTVFDTAAYFANCSHVALNGCSVYACGRSRAAHFTQGTRAVLAGCLFEGASDSLIRASENVDLTVVNAKGSGAPYFLWSEGAVIKWCGTRPAGNWWNGNADGSLNVTSIVLTDAGSTDLKTLTVDSNSGEAPEEIFANGGWPAVNTDSYSTNLKAWEWYYPTHETDDNDVRQGYTETVGRVYGCIWFDNAAIKAALSGRTVRQAALRLTRMTGSGSGGGSEVTVYAYGLMTAYSGRSGAPVISESGWNLGSIGAGATHTFTLPVEIVERLADGTYQGIALNTGESSLWSDRKYSRNYTRFAGETSWTEETKPYLTATYGG